MNELKDEQIQEQTKVSEKKQSRFRWWYPVAFSFTFLILLYLGFSIFYMNHFYKGTVINNVNCSNLTVKQAEEKIKEKVKAYTLKIKARNDLVEQIKGTDFELKYMLEFDLEEVNKLQNAFLWPASLFVSSIESLPSSVEYNGKKFADLINSLTCLNKKNMKQPVNAKISKYSSEDDCYRIIPEDVGTFLFIERVIEKCKEAVQTLQSELSLDEQDCYKKVAISSEDARLNKALKKMNNYISTKITYKFGDKDEILNGDIIQKWIRHTKKNEVILSKDGVKEYVKNLARTYDTFGKSRKFKTSYKKTITINGGDYGWWMNQAKETEELFSLIKKGKTTKRSPSYFQKAAEYGKKDYGDTYVEINLETQQLFYYKKGKRILESDIVSGNVSKGDASPLGVFGIMYTQHHAVLRGVDYNTPVEFWMPFYGNVGMHDATWRSRFGGNIYRTGGSHGCINMPYANAKKLFQYVETKTPVICYRFSKEPPVVKSTQKPKVKEKEKSKNKTKKKSN